MPQSLSQIWIHIIFSTKERYPFLIEALNQERLYEYIKGICKEHQCHVAAIGGIEDHIHLLVNMNKKISLSSLIEEIKKASSKWIKTIDNNKLSQFYWQRGYGAFSVSQSNIERVKLYIKNQNRHHQTLSFQDELKKFLIQHGVAFDEKYLFD